MKHKRLGLLLASAAAIVGAFALSACTPSNNPDDSGAEHEHTFVTYTPNGDATCTRDGTKTAQCTYVGCGETDTVTNDGSKLDHIFTNYNSNFDATCTEDGTKTAHCDYGCGTPDTITEEGSAKEHYYNYYNEEEAYICQNCNERMPDDQLNIYWSEVGKSYSVIGLGTKHGTEIVIPSTYKGKPVDLIGYGAFQGTQIESIVIPEGITDIWQSAFENCTELKSISIPSSLTNIAGTVFENCKNLKRVNISDIASWCNVEMLSSNSNPLNYGGELYVDNTAVTELTVPDTVTEIKDYTFYGCTSITDVKLPDGLIEIGQWAFGYCPSLKSIVIPDSVKSISFDAFSDCGDLTEIIYKGTVEEWNSISKVNGWNYNTGDYTVHCTNGNITK